MFDRMLPALLLLVVPNTLFANLQFQAEPRTYTAHGTVVNSTTGEAVSGALVQIYGSRQHAMLTGPDGKFQFEGLPNGSFQVSAQKPGYFSPEQIRRNGAPLTLVNTEEEHPITLKLIPEGIVYGRITGDNGEPLGYMPVQILWERVENGKRTRENARSVRTDEQGEFRQAELQPGKYFVFVGPSPWPASFPARLSQGGARGYPGVYYPGVPDLASAASVEITPGKHAEINLSLSSQPFYRISGTVSGYGPEQGVTMQMVSASGQPIGAGVQFDEARGMFRSSWVPAGVCTITAESQDSKTNQQSYASRKLNITSDLGGVHLALLPSALIPLNIQVETTRNDTQADTRVQIFSGGGRNQMSAQQPSPARVVLTPQQHLFMQQQQYSESATDEDPTPAVRNVPPGVYSVEIYPNGPYYVQSARSGSVDVLEQGLTVAPGGSNQPIDVVLRDDFANLEGSLKFDAESEFATVLIISANSSANSSANAPQQRRNFMVMNTAPSFQIPQLTPGEYKILAVNNPDEFEYGNPDVVRKYLSKARDVSLVPNQKAKVELEIVRIGD
jgi:Carboxypeptidase regulatory-like domain